MQGLNYETVTVAESQKRRYEDEIFRLEGALDDARREKDCKVEELQIELSRQQSYCSEIETENQQLKLENEVLRGVFAIEITSFLKGVEFKTHELFEDVKNRYPTIEW